MDKNNKKKTNNITKDQDCTWDNLVKNGKRITSSTSKIKNTIANKKNRNLNGKVPGSAELNPHSKGLWISRSNFIFLVKPTMINLIAKARAKPETKILKFIKIETYRSLGFANPYTFYTNKF